MRYPCRIPRAAVGHVQEIAVVVDVLASLMNAVEVVYVPELIERSCGTDSCRGWTALLVWWGRSRVGAGLTASEMPVSQVRESEQCGPRGGESVRWSVLSGLGCPRSASAFSVSGTGDRWRSARVCRRRGRRSRPARSDGEVTCGPGLGWKGGPITGEAVAGCGLRCRTGRDADPWVPPSGVR